MCVIVLITIYIQYINYEPFASKKATGDAVATSQQLNFDKELKGYQIKTIPLGTGWDYVLYQLHTNQPLKIYDNPTYIIMDPIDYIENASYYSAKELTSGYFFVITSTLKKSLFNCGFDFTNKNIGYFDVSEKKLIDTIAFTHRTNVKPVHLSIDIIDRLDAAWKDVDAIVMYIVPNSALAKIVERQHIEVLDISSVSLDRLRFAYPFLEFETIEKSHVFRQNNRVVTPAETITTLKMQMILVTLSPTTEDFITRLTISDHAKNPNFKCIVDETIKISKECEAPFDIYGRPKLSSSMDKSCAKNTDCPFYKANTNYPNLRGGCLPTGHCEMPLGMKRIGYTKYFDHGQYAPFCYQCKDITDPSCCENQKKYPHLTSPDYAFPNDAVEREKAKLPTYARLSSIL
jgi:hypothetical protein